MAMYNDPRPPLPEWILNAYDILTTHTTDVEGDKNTKSITRDHAANILQETDDLALELEDARYALTRLLERGYFYEVDDELYVTPTD
ncbi:hypothetical protein [Halomontanus rarus]|uniref:hypothetical protein n=1 Tax=Halomontanus rarus TaxID=3034020 RepID=UPI00293BD7B6|nr:hypothetical protein [Halovivax sp. KZCA124]